MIRQESSKIIFALTIFLGGLFIPQKADALFGRAKGCGCDIISIFHDQTRSVVNVENQQVREQVKSSFQQQTDDLREQLDKNVRQIITQLERQSRLESNIFESQIEANQRFVDAVQVNKMNQLRDEFRAKAESGIYDPNPYSCILVDTLGSPTGQRPGRRVITDVSAHISGNTEATQEGGVDLARHVAEKSEEFANFKGSTHGATDWSLLTEDPTIDFDDPEMAEAAKLIVQNGLDSTPERAVNPQERFTQKGLNRIAANEERNSRLSSASQSIQAAFDMRSSRLEGDDVDAYRVMAENSAYNRAIGDKLSELQILDINTVWHYAPVGERLATLTNTAGMNERAWMHELHRALSINARLNYMRLEIANRNAIVKANILATIADNS